MATHRLAVGLAEFAIFGQIFGVVDAVLGPPGNVFYFVADLAAAAAWYSARLGSEPVTRAAQLVMFDLNGTRLTLHEADAFNQPGPSGTAAMQPTGPPRLPQCRPRGKSIVWELR